MLGSSGMVLKLGLQHLPPQQGWKGPALPAWLGPGRLEKPMQMRRGADTYLSLDRSWDVC